jgi:hypothetical protein
MRFTVLKKLESVYRKTQDSSKDQEDRYNIYILYERDRQDVCNVFEVQKTGEQYYPGDSYVQSPEKLKGPDRFTSFMDAMVRIYSASGGKTVLSVRVQYATFVTEPSNKMADKPGNLSENIEMYNEIIYVITNYHNLRGGFR